MIHMKYQDLFSDENKKRKLKLLSALVVTDAFRVKRVKTPFLKRAKNLTVVLLKSVSFSLKYSDTNH